MNHANVDNSEIDKFDSLADEWWDPEGQLKTLHSINPVRLNYIHRAVPLSGKAVLDIGCGGGILSQAMAEIGADVTGLDASPVAIEIAKQHQQSLERENNVLDVCYIAGTAEEFSEKNTAQFDVITCMELLEHVPEPATLISACANMLKPQGHIFLATINRNIKSYAATILAAEYLLGLLPKGTHDYKSFIRPAELSACLRQSGFQINDISGMSYIPGVEYCSLINRPDVNYLMHAQLKD